MKIIAAFIVSFLISFSAPAHASETKEALVISLEGDVDEASVKTLRDAIDAANKDGIPAIVMEINSRGGDVEAGFLLAKTIERSKAPVTCVVDGIAASMASFILQSCKVRVMTKRSTLMIHEPASYYPNGFGGQPVVWQNVTDRLRYLTKAMMEHYARRMKITVQELINKVYGGRSWFLSPEEAVSFHAVDFVVESYEDLFLK